MYRDISTTTHLPKTLVIRNHLGGMVWQIYHIEEESEAEILSGNATNNGFQAITLEDHMPDEEETFPNMERRLWMGKENITLNHET